LDLRSRRTLSTFAASVKGATGMGILEIFYAFQTQEQAVEYLERVRWSGHPICPYCQSEKVCRHVSGDRKGQRWQCQECTRAFAVTVGTIFHRTHVPLRQWYLLLALMLDGSTPASAHGISRDLGMRRPTVANMMRRVRAAMASDDDQASLLSQIVSGEAG
jgi:transposase-like protein